MGPGQTAWLTVQHELPTALRGTPPSGSLASAVIDRPVCRQLLANTVRRHGACYRPRKPIDVTAALVYVTGKVATVPCVPCKKKHGPWAYCVVPPSGANLIGREAECCANCIYQGQAHRCQFANAQPQSSLEIGSQQVANLPGTPSALCLGDAVGKLFYHHLERYIRATPTQREQIKTSAQMDLLAAQVVATGDAGANVIDWAREKRETQHTIPYTGQLGQTLSAQDSHDDELYDEDRPLH